MKNVTFLAAVNWPRRLVGRKKHLEQIRQIIFDEGNRCRVVLIKGKGGLGKTRLLEEVLARLGSKEKQDLYLWDEEETWNHQEQVFMAKLLDLADIRLQTREYFLEKLADPFTWQGEIDFGRYAVAHARWQRLAEYGAAHTMAKPASKEAEDAFWRDYKEAAEKHHLVIPLDTAEQLAFTSSEWLLKHNLLQQEELRFNTQQWLLEQIAAGRFQNTTLLIAGRDSDEEGGPYFKEVEEAVKSAGPQCQKYEMKVKPFTEEETEQYFTYLQEDLKAASKEQSTSDYVHDILKMLLSDKERLQVLYHYTGGQPIRLSLYTDVLVESRVVPEPLQQSLADAQANTKSNGTTETEELLQARREIEAEFIDVLFGPEGGLRGRILRSLARTTRGLSAEQLHFVLDSDPVGRVEAWQPDPARLKEIKKEIEELKRLSIVKVKPSDRLGLQDEMYRIFAECMAVDSTRHKETNARRREYERLAQRADHTRKKLYAIDERFIKEDLDRIRVERPANILSTRIATPTPTDAEARNQLVQELLDTELEYLHYALLIDPNFHFNNTYDNLSNDRVNAYREEQVALFQAEMWRALHDEYAFKFIEIPTRQALIERGEKPLDVLRRAVQIDDAVNWIVRFYLRGEYQEAIDLANNIDKTVAQLEDGNEKHAWNHTFARSEREVWRTYIETFLGKDIQKYIIELEETTAVLEALSQADVNTLVFPNRGENGFIGHPALPRLRLVITIAYNWLGYGYVTLGNFRRAVEAYAKSLQYARRLPLPFLSSQEATVRNNLSRALVEMGKKRAIRICQDGLDLRKRLGDWLPIAYSYNTLGLIHNDLYEPRQALIACAHALAISQRVQHPRALGLILIQLGEALRRLVASESPTVLEDSPEEVYREAEKALRQAVEIFTESAAAGEPVRLIEAHTELGCLYRDWMKYTNREGVPDIWRRRRHNALHYLQEAVDQAEDLGLIRLQLDAQVNLGWTHYHAKEYDEAVAALEQAESLVLDEARLQKDKPPPRRGTIPDYFFKQMSKISGLHGRMAFGQFLEETGQLAKAQPETTPEERRQIVRDDEEMQLLLKRAADTYVQSLAYAELFSSRSVALTIIYDHLYDYLKQLNYTEMADFYRYEEEATQCYRIHDIRPENFGELRDFLLDCFGDYYHTELIWLRR